MGMLLFATTPAAALHPVRVPDQSQLVVGRLDFNAAGITANAKYLPHRTPRVKNRRRSHRWPRARCVIPIAIGARPFTASLFVRRSTDNQKSAIQTD